MSGIFNVTLVFANLSNLQFSMHLSAGGVKLVGYNNRIVVNNTLDERLRLLEEQVSPLA